MLAVGDVVEVLHRRDLDDLAHPLQGGQVDLAHADVADLSLGLHLAELAERVFHRRVRVDAVQLVEVEALETEPPQ